MGTLLSILFCVVYIFLGNVYEAFRIDISRKKEIWLSQILSIFLSDTVMYFLMVLLAGKMITLVSIFVVFLVQIMLAGIWTLLCSKIYDRCNPSQKTAILYSEIRDEHYLKNIHSISRRFQVEKWICVSQSAETMLKELEGIKVVFMRGLSSNERNTVLKYCIAHNIEVYQYPKIGDVIMTGAEQLHMFHEPVMYSCRYNPSLSYMIIKRFLDVCVSLLGIVILSPLFLLVALSVKIYDRGPAIFSQVRLTQNGKKFKIYKFRSMRMDAEKDGVARLAEKEDSRITPVGKFIRAVRLDELPQLFNVLKGDMSLVGPRPERPEIAEVYMQEMPEFALRLQAKAGITGYAQVYGTYNTLPYDKLQMDLLYISRPSIYMDFKLLLATIKVLFMKESSEGIEEGMVMAGIPHTEHQYEEIKGNIQNEI